MSTLKRYSIYFVLLFVASTLCKAEPVDVNPLPVELHNRIMVSGITKLNRSLINLHKSRINQQLIRNHYERIALTSATVAVVAATGWYAFKTPAVVEQSLTQDANTNISLMNKKADGLTVQGECIMQQLAQIKNQLNIKGTGAIKQQVPHSLLKAWGKSIWGIGEAIVKNSAIQMGVLVVSGVLPLPRPIMRLINYWGDRVEKIGEHFYHDSDFYWYLTTQTQTVAYFKDLERAAELLPLATDEEDREHQKKSILWSADILVKQLARIVAFMEYQAIKLKVLNTGCSIRMQASAKYMYRHVDQFSHTLESMLKDRSKHAEIPAYIKSFRERLRSEQDSFCVNEHAALYDISDGVA